MPTSRVRRLLVTVALFASSLALVPTQAAEAPRRPCDALDPALCMLPFPNDRFTRPDSSSPTGLRIDFKLAEMPRSIAGKSIDPTAWNRNDGFSPGSMVLTFVPGLDLRQTWDTASMSHDLVGTPIDPRDHISDISRYQAPDAPILLVDGTTGERWPFWSELDNNALTGDHERLLILRPAVNFLEGHTYYVALRNLKDDSGAEIPAGDHFAAYRDGTAGPLTDPTFEESRRTEVEGVIDSIASAETGRGNAFDRSDLYLAWKFTIASAEGMASDVLHIRDQSLAALGDTVHTDNAVQGDAPQFKILSVTEFPGDTRKLRQVDGRVTVPNYLDQYPLPPTEQVNGLPAQATPGARFLRGIDGKPMVNPAFPTIEVDFVCTIPRAATASDPANPMLYGHGLLGSRGESRGGSTDRMRERNFMPCATNWMGFANYDIANAVVTLTDPSNMASMSDRSQQGFLNWTILARAIKHSQGLVQHPAFRDENGNALFHTNELVYDGNSQGGIMGGALTALAVDFTRATLGVPGMNYSTLLNRSVDWEGPLFNPPDLPSYSSVLYTMFPDKKEQQLVIAIIQMLWDRAEGNGYAQHMTHDPLPNTPAHRVMLHVALGDFQVANVSAEVEARTIGARVMDTALGSGRHWELDPYFGLQPMPRDSNGDILPWSGSALVYWDSGNLVPPNANVPPALDGGDPHEDPRRDPLSGDQRAHFFKTGQVIDVFNGGPYLLCRPGAEGSIPRVPSLFNNDWCPRS